MPVSSHYGYSPVRASTVSRLTGNVAIGYALDRCDAELARPVTPGTTDVRFRPERTGSDSYLMG
jgi:hypothetical protein